MNQQVKPMDWAAFEEDAKKGIRRAKRERAEKRRELKRRAVWMQTAMELGTAFEDPNYMRLFWVLVTELAREGYYKIVDGLMDCFERSTLSQ